MIGKRCASSEKSKMLSYKKKNKRLREVTQDKVVSLSDYRRLKKTKGTRTLLVFSLDNTLREKIKAKFTNHFQIFLVDNATAFSNFLQTYELDFIFLDQRNQSWKAYDLCKQIKTNDRLIETSVIVLADQKADKEEVIKSFKVGCDELIKDDTDMDRVIRTIDYLLKS